MFRRADAGLGTVTGYGWVTAAMKRLFPWRRSALFESLDRIILCFVLLHIFLFAAPIARILQNNDAAYVNMQYFKKYECDLLLL